MFSKAALIGGLMLGLGAGYGAQAQIESDSMDDLGAWGQRYLSSNETEFPTTLWRNSNDEYLLSLLQSVQTATLGPAERQLLRRLILSPATPPRGARAEELLAERARLMLELGEARAAAALVPQLAQAAPGLDAETLAVDLDLASGQEATACNALNGDPKDGEYWLKLRAVCAILRDNFSGAQLAIEFAAAQGVEDAWMIEAIFAAAGDTPNPPGARFDSGLNIALSSKAILDLSNVTLAADRPDLAAAAARRPGVPSELRARFAEIASASELIKPEDRRAVLLSLLEDEDYTPGAAIEQALATQIDPLANDEARAEQLSSVLKEQANESLNQYRDTARLFLPDLASLPKTFDTAAFALDFAQAAMVAGDRELAMAWIAATAIEGVEQPDPYQIALLEAADIILGGEASRPSLRAIEKRLVGTVNSRAREDQAARIFAVWTGFGVPLSPIARDFVAGVSDQGERIAQGQITGLKAATLDNAIGETALRVLTTTNGDAGRLSASDFAVLLDTLIALEAEDVARDLALETTEFWKEFE
ncbi:MAG: hypothetical protein AAF437_00030 [Pseudomonadota bacterium]